MDVTFFFRGLLIGLSIAAPVGPIGVLCIRRTLAEGRAAGLVSGLGAATADTLYGFVAAFGLTFISGFLVRQQSWFRLVGGLFLCYLGVRTLLARPREGATPAPAGGRGLLAAYTSTLFLTLTNPITILFFAGIFAGLGTGIGGSYASAAVLVAGVLAGSALWWFTLSGLVSLFRTRFDARALRWVNALSGLVIVGFGLAALYSLKG
jgi:threonine/homoserine/homoserine lactone efflux protein